jgi:hypothetical protein
MNRRIGSLYTVFSLEFLLQTLSPDDERLLVEQKQEPPAGGLNAFVVRFNAPVAKILRLATN